MASIASLVSRTLALPPSCIVFCPTQPDLFVVGTYFLHKQENALANGEAVPPQKRTGSLIVFHIESVSENEEQELRIYELCTLETEWAVLDVQWSPHRSKGDEAIAVATSTGLVELYKLERAQEDNSAKLVSSTWLGPFDDPDVEEERDILTLSLAWHPTRSEVMALTFSDGAVQYCSTEGDFATMGHHYTSGAAHNHDLEAWTAAFSPTSRGIFSGGDDCVLRYLRPGWDETNGITGIEASWQDKKLHDAGVTAILPFNDHLVVTGSYDDHVRLISAPEIGRRQVLADRNLGGGVWRLKMVESDNMPDPEAGTGSLPFECIILASCMHAGTRVLRLCRGAEGSWHFEVIAQFTEHKSMNYGSDVQPLDPATSDRRTRTVVSTSFYDNLLCVWKVDIDGKAPVSADE